MNELIDRALDAADRAGASYADVRVVERQNEGLTVKNGVLEAANTNVSAGFGVRVLIDGAWGFSSSAVLDPSEADRIAAEAAEIARASKLAQRQPVVLDDTPPAVDTYRTPYEEDPFDVSLDDKLRILMEADAAMARVSGVAIREGNMSAGRERKTFASTAGARIDQEIVEAGGGLEATAVNESEMQQRSYPNSFGGQMVTGGFESVRALDLAEHAQETAELAVALLDAPQCPSGEMDLILDSTQVALQIHESCGHPTELDRVLGTEASFAGTSFLTTDKLGKLRYGSEHVNIDADATATGGLGTFGYDDEGVPAQNVPLIERGMLAGYLTGRESAPIIGRRSMGSSRAWSWKHIPLIRMTNINLRPGDAGSLEDLLADTREGIFMSVNKSWSIDDRRLNFQFGTEIAWEIRNGQLGAMLRNPTYTGITPEFWGACDAVCGEADWVMWGTPNCGKGQP
ncbi:MAG: TldD/PmbA family protein, partial [Candidatus Limnocylindria bacterium]